MPRRTALQEQLAKIGRIGGAQRARLLTAARRREIAQMGGRAKAAKQRARKAD